MGRLSSIFKATQLFSRDLSKCELVRVYAAFVVYNCIKLATEWYGPTSVM